MVAGKLTERNKKFCQEYPFDFNGGAAYLRAGYKCSLRAAQINAAKLLAKPSIQAYLQKIQKPALTKAEVTLERTLAEISHVAFSRITDVVAFDADGVALTDSKKLPDAVNAAIAEVKFTRTVKTSRRGDSESETESTSAGAKMHNKMQALTLLSKHFGIDNDFNTARAALKRYGMALVSDETVEIGWRLEKHVEG